MKIRALLPILRRRATPAGDLGATAVEYSLLVVSIAVVIVAVVFLLGRATSTQYGTTCSAWDSAAGTTGC